jgi:hypothetical protein
VFVLPRAATWYPLYEVKQRTLPRAAAGFTDFHNQGHTLGLFCHLNTNFAHPKFFPNKQKHKERTEIQTNTTSSDWFALCSALVCFLQKRLFFLTTFIGVFAG